MVGIRVPIFYLPGERLLLLFHPKPSFWPPRTGLAPSLPSIASQSSENIFYQLIPGNHQLRLLASALLFCSP